jgi:uncharacterized BrkB/YihY/UPF0761 family membrane protein
MANATKPKIVSSNQGISSEIDQSRLATTRQAWLRRTVAICAYVLLIAAGLIVCWEFFENTARPHVVIALSGAFLAIAGAYLLRTELGTGGV